LIFFLTRGDALRSAQRLPLAIIFRAFGADARYVEFESGIVCPASETSRITYPRNTTDFGLAQPLTSQDSIAQHLPEYLTAMHDLIYCFRMLRKRPSFTVVAVLTLALAIGASTALFSIVNVVVLNPFAYKDPSLLFFVRQSLPKIGVQDQFRISGLEFVDIAKSGIFERVSAFEAVSRNLTGSDEPERIAAAKVSTEFFTMLGVEPLLGRTIAPNEQGPGGQRVLVISHGLWQRRFGGDKAVLGQKVSLDDEPFTIIGVMPPQFRFEEQQAWFPFPFDFSEGQRAGRAFAIVGRISPATTVPQVNDSDGRNNVCFSFNYPVARRFSRMSYSGETSNESRSIGSFAV